MQSEPVTFTYIRNRISEFSKESLYSIAFSVLKKLERNPKENYPIFLLLTLIKWVAIYGGNKYPPKIAQIKDFDKLMSQISSLATFGQLFDLRNPKDLTKVLTIAAHQQFYLQDQIIMSVIWRQLVLYLIIKTQYDIQGSFKAHAGLEIIDFFKIIFLISIQANPERLGNSHIYDGTISPAYIQAIDKNTSVETRGAFLRLLCFGSDESINRLKKDSAKLKRLELQPLDTDFFAQYPLFRYGGQIFLLHRSILPYTIRHYVYDFLKEKDSQFTTDFGRRMEQYIGMGINETGLECISENHFKRQYPTSRYQVDFVVSKNILIESKAIALPALPSVLPDEAVLYNALKDSLVKAYVYQMLSVANFLKAEGEYFGVIITYKKLYLGNALEWNSFLQEKTEQFCAENNLNTDLLPQSNLFIIDIDTWDLIIQLIVENRAVLTDLLKYFRSQNTNPETEAFEIRIHLRDYFPIDVNLSFHKEADKLFKFI